MSRWLSSWQNYIQNKELKPSEFIGYVHEYDCLYLLVPDDFDTRQEGYCQLCGIRCYPYTPTLCDHLRSDKHAKNVKQSHLIPWCNPPGAIRRDLVVEPDEMTETLEVSEDSRCKECAYRKQSSNDTNDLMHKMTQLEDKVKTMNETLNVLKVKVDDGTSFFHAEAKDLKSRISALETVHIRD